MRFEYKDLSYFIFFDFWIRSTSPQEADLMETSVTLFPFNLLQHRYQLYIMS